MAITNWLSVGYEYNFEKRAKTSDLITILKSADGKYIKCLLLTCYDNDADSRRISRAVKRRISLQLRAKGYKQFPFEILLIT
jgi:hypothetical protein